MQNLEVLVGSQWEGLQPTSAYLRLLPVCNDVNKEKLENVATRGLDKEGNKIEGKEKLKNRDSRNMTVYRVLLEKILQ